MASMRRVRPRGLADMRGLALNRQPPDSRRPPSTARRDRSRDEHSGQNHLSPAPRTKARWVNAPVRRLTAGQSGGKFALNCPCRSRDMRLFLWRALRLRAPVGHAFRDTRDEVELNASFRPRVA